LFHQGLKQWDAPATGLAAKPSSILCQSKTASFQPDHNAGLLVEGPDKSDSLRTPISVSLLLGRRTFACLALLVALLCAALLATKVRQIDRLLVLLLERRFQRPLVTAPESLTGIIVLTGDDARLAEVGRLARLYPHSLIVISGANGMPALPAELSGGIEPGRVVLERRANNTYENAVYSADLIRPKPGEAGCW
jgi:uncharacterized SAM-binding protein YcdF (DUF218 family)